MIDDKEVIVKMEHIRAANMCSRGARAFFERNNLDWQGFLRQGVAASDLIATGDIMALQVVEVARGK